MDATLNRTSLRWGVPGVILQTLGPIAMNRAQPHTIWVLVFAMLALVGTAMLLVGLGYYAQARGHSRWWGLAGLLNIAGIIALALLPDKHKAQERRSLTIDDFDIPDGTQSPFGDG